MPLSLGDIRRLRGLGYRLWDFVVVVHGERRLRNVDGRCFFLNDGKCRVYGDRPVGCQLYPLVADSVGSVKIDPGCKYRDKFVILNSEAERLRGLIRLLKRETRRELV